MKRGFTLIETMVYLALYSIIIGGALAAVYSLSESSARNSTSAMLEEEGDYLRGKIEWTLSETASVLSPASSGDTLSVTRLSGSSVNIDSVHSSMRIQDNSAAWQILNDANVSVSKLVFLHAVSTSDGLDPESISASFTLYATTSDGHELSRDFTTLDYIRK